MTFAIIFSTKIAVYKDWSDIMDNKQYVCPKCNGKRYERDEIHIAKSVFMNSMNSDEYETITCKHCGYTEFYKVLYEGFRRTENQYLNNLINEE